jgi:hypothetical protein
MDQSVTSNVSFIHGPMELVRLYPHCLYDIKWCLMLFVFALLACWCLIRGRNCLPFKSTRVRPWILEGSVLLIFLVFCFVCLRLEYPMSLVFVLCLEYLMLWSSSSVLSTQCLWSVHSLLPFQFSLTFVLNTTFFIVPSQESERSYIFIVSSQESERSYIFIGFWNCTNNVVYFCFSFYSFNDYVIIAFDGKNRFLFLLNSVSVGSVLYTDFGDVH